jgi:electron transport complex protein RnfG
MAMFGFKLGVVCLSATAALALVNRATAPQIHKQAELELQAGLKEVLPQAASFSPVMVNNATAYYRAFDGQGALTGAAFIASKKGYSSEIQTMVGLNLDGTISAVKVLEPVGETPGLGSRITEVKDDTTLFDALAGKKKNAAARPWFQEQFSGKRANEIASVNSITGATISSKAVIEAVQEKAQEIILLMKNEE